VIQLRKQTLCALALLPLLPLLGVACGGSTAHGPITGTVVRFDAATLTAANDFYGMPFPSDLRLDGVGIGLAGFPNPMNSTLLQQYVAALHDSVRGFGTNAPMYVGFSAAIDPSTLPTDPVKTLRADSPVQVIDIDAGAGTAGIRIPVLFHWYPTKTLFLAANTLAIRPVPGTPLLSNHKYALVITSALKDAAGAPVVADALTRVVLGRWDPVDADDRAIGTTQPFLRWAHSAQFDVDAVEMVSVFTTQDASGTMALARTAVRASPVPAISNLSYLHDTNSTHVFTGKFSVPNFQAGTPPYLSSGGNFVFDAQGFPIAQRTEQVRFALTVPKGTPPAAGWPIVIYAHGTGGSYLSFSQEGANDGAAHDAMADAAAKQGLASLCMDQVLHGPRNPSCDETSPDYETCVGTGFFNFFNPYAGRDNARQGGVDDFQLVRLAHELTIPATVDPEGLVPTLDPGHIVFLGHSQGSLTGAPFVAAESELKGAAFSGAGGLLTLTILERTNPIDFKTLAEQILGISGVESLDIFHPVLALVQTFIEPADTINYALAAQQQPLFSDYRDVLLIEGMHDTEVPQDSAEALGAAALLPIGVADGGAPQHAGPGFIAAGLGTVTLPVHDNVQLVGGQRTGVMLQFGGPNDDHFTMFDNPVANCQVMSFLKSSVTGLGATVPLCTP
jgi:hypothetical protein